MEYKSVYFLGIGGIGMSAIARYFLHEGVRVGGYDLTETQLTRQLTTEGADIHYADDPDRIDEAFRHPDHTLVVYTPAVPHDLKELVFFRENGFTIEKRSEMLGHLSEGKFVMAVAGTHGKTTTTTLTAWLNACCCPEGGCAFLGGISKNFGSNLVLGEGNRFAVEADEFDRSFLRLHPDVAVVTSADADHLDIYGTHEAVKEAFSQFIGQIRPGGALILKKGVDVAVENPSIHHFSYALSDPQADFHAENIRPMGNGHFLFDIVTPEGPLADCTLGIPGEVNIENAVAAVALFRTATTLRKEPMDNEKIREALARFSGVRRRFELYINTPESVYMDDYAHHPRELSAALASLRGMFPGRKITAVFQPHLYTRTRDLYKEFAAALSMADRVILIPIYPAREEPIPGVTSEMIGNELTVPWSLTERDTLADTLAAMDTDVVVTFGAGNIENCCPQIAARLREKYGL